MFKNILVPFDHSDPAERALQSAIELVAPGGTITLLEATSGISPNAAAEAEKSLKEIAEGAQDTTEKDITFKIQIMVGLPAPSVVKYAKSADVELIVMGRRGLSAVRSMLGSVSQRVVKEVELPVLLIK